MHRRDRIEYKKRCQIRNRNSTKPKQTVVNGAVYRTFQGRTIPENVCTKMGGSALRTYTMRNNDAQKLFVVVRQKRRNCSISFCVGATESNRRAHDRWLKTSLHAATKVIWVCRTGPLVTVRPTFRRRALITRSGRRRGRDQLEHFHYSSSRRHVVFKFYLILRTFNIYIVSQKLGLASVYSFSVRTLCLCMCVAKIYAMF